MAVVKEKDGQHWQVLSLLIPSPWTMRCIWNSDLNSPMSRLTYSGAAYSFAVIVAVSIL